MNTYLSLLFVATSWTVAGVEDAKQAPSPCVAVKPVALPPLFPRLHSQNMECWKKRPQTMFEWSLKTKKEKCEESDKSGKDKEKNGKKTDKNGKDEEKNGTTKNDDNKTNGNTNEDREEKKSNGDGDQEEEDEDDDTIATDRPDFTEASSTVGGGRVQLEAGWTYSRDGSAFHGNSYPELLWRIGLTNWFELRIGQNFGSEKAVQDGATERHSGAEDLYLGVKLGLTKEKSVFLPEMSLIVQTTVPTGADNFNAKIMLPGVNLLYGADIIKDCLSYGASTQVNRATDGFAPFDGLNFQEDGDAVHYHVQFAQSFTFGYTLTKRLGAYTEWFAFFPMGAVDPEVGPEYYFDGGFTYKVSRYFQLDWRGGVGLNDHAADTFTGVGFAYKY